MKAAVLALYCFLCGAFAGGTATLAYDDSSLWPMVILMAAMSLSGAWSVGAVLWSLKT